MFCYECKQDPCTCGGPKIIGNDIQEVLRQMRARTSEDFEKLPMWDPLVDDPLKEGEGHE